MSPLKRRGRELVCRTGTNAGSLLQLAPLRLVRFAGRRLSKGQLLYERRNGSFALQVTGHPDFDVPFGQDRLVPIPANSHCTPEEPGDVIVPNEEFYQELVAHPLQTISMQ